MAEVKLNNPVWLGSEEGAVRKTATVSSASGATVVENGRTIIKSGTLITDANLGKVLLYNDADVTDGAVVKSVLYAGYYVDGKLPTSVASSAEALAEHGLFAIKFAPTTVAYGEVN